MTEVADARALADRHLAGRLPRRWRYVQAVAAQAEGSSHTERHSAVCHLVVGDLERSKTFYREVFGLPPLEEEGLAVFGFKNMYVALRKDAATCHCLGWPASGSTLSGRGPARLARC